MRATGSTSWPARAECAQPNLTPHRFRPSSSLRRRGRRGAPVLGLRLQGRHDHDRAPGHRQGHPDGVGGAALGQRDLSQQLPGRSNAPYCPIRSPLGSFPICREITPRDSDSRPLGAAKGSSAFSQPREVLRQRGHGLRLQAERHTSTDRLGSRACGRLSASLQTLWPQNCTTRAISIYLVTLCS